MTSRSIEMAVRGAVSRTQPWADRVARVGYVAKGLVFMLVGGLAERARGKRHGLS